MLVHVYASYKGSPIGFNPGSFTYQTNRADNYTLSYKVESTLIYRIFEKGYIKGAEGCMPQSSKMLLLVKNLEYTYANHAEFGKNVDVNIAFEFDDKEKYADFVSGFHSLDKATLPEKVASFIIPDEDDKEYALHIDAAQFNRFIKAVGEHTSNVNIFTDHFELLTRVSDKTEFDKEIKELFGVSFDREGVKYVYPSKKNSNLNSQISTKKPSYSMGQRGNSNRSGRLSKRVKRTNKSKVTIIGGLFVAVLIAFVFIVLYNLFK